MMCFALYFAAMIHITNKISPKEIVVTMFGIVNGTYFSLALFVGNLGGGALYEQYGGSSLFLIDAVVVLAWTCFTVVYYFRKTLFRIFCNKQ